METARQKTVNRAATVQQPAASVKTVQRKAVTTKSSVQLQMSTKVSSPNDPAEKEADATAKKIMRMAVSESSIAYMKTGSGGVFRQVKQQEKDKKLQTKLQSPYITRFADSGIFTQPKKPDEEKIQRKAEGQPNVASNVAADIQNSMATGSPLPLSVRRFMEPRFNADFSNVKIHTGDNAARLNKQLNAQAFAMGNHIFFGKDKFKPDSQESKDKELIAHELTHTIQQGAAIQRSEEVSVTQHSPVQVQRLGLSDALDYFADKANLIPGFRMFTIILGVNPINMSTVDRSAANILRALVEFLPGGGLIVQALDNYGIFERIGNWVEQQIRSLGMTGSVIRQAIDRFLDSLSWTDIFDLGGVWNRAKRIFTEPIDRIISFGRGLINGIIQFIKDAILRPLARLAEGTRGYDLLKAVLGQDPITGDPVPRNADTLIGGFMKLIGQEEVWNNLKRANAVARAWEWFQGALSGLLGFVRQIPSMFLQALRSLEIADLVLLPRAFARVGSAFASFLGQFFSWAGQQVMSLLQIIFEVVAPGAMPYIRRAAGAFRSIIQNPISFVGNLVRAGIMGFRQFAGRFLTHLRTSLISWLTGTLSGAGVYIPQAFTLREIIKFVLSVLGLTWQNIRQKLVRVIGETAVSALETGFDIVMTLVTQGPAAAWEKIQESLSNLREMVMEQIMTFVRDRVVQAAITRLVTSLNPAGAFIQAIIATYNTIMFFVERLRQIAQVAMSFIDSISAIASGVLTTAANRVEQTMAGLLTLVISFLARIAGLGRVSDAVTNIINRVRAPIDRALDRVVDWIVAQARRLGSFFRGRDARSPEEKQRDLDRAVRELRPLVRELLRRGPPGRLFALRLVLWKRQYRLTDLSVQPSGAVVATINPTGTIDQLVPQSNQVALSVIHNEIINYFNQRSTSGTAAAVLRTGSGTRQRPYDPGSVGSPFQGVRAVLQTPGAAPGETSWIVGTHAGRPVVAIIQRTRNPRSPNQGEVFILNPATGRRVSIGAYSRSQEVPGISPAPQSTGQTAASVVSDPFVRGGAPGSGSLAAGYSEEMAVERRVGASISVQEAQVAGAVTLLGAVEGTRNPLGAVTIPSMMERTTRSGRDPGTTLAETMGGPQAAVGSGRDWQLAQHAISRFEPQTGVPRPSGSPDIVPDPFPRGVTQPSRGGSQIRAAAHLNMSVDTLANTILQGMVTNGVVLLPNASSLDSIREKTREYLQQRYR